MTEMVPRSFHEEADPELVEYRSISVAAVLGLLLGVFAPLAMIGPLLWIVPAAGAAVSAWALWSIAHREGALTGATIARIGLALSLIFGAAAPAAVLSESWYLRSEARPVAEHWFELLQDDQPHEAHQLTLEPRERQLPERDVWSYYRSSAEARDGLQRFVNDPLIHAVLAQGREAEIRYYGTQGYGDYDDKQQVSQYYAITYPDGDRKATFFARVILERSLQPETGEARWKINAYESGIRPFSWDKPR